MRPSCKIRALYDLIKSSLQIKPTICSFCTAPSLHLKRSLLLWDYCLSAWCTWSSAMSKMHNIITQKVSGDYFRLLCHMILHTVKHASMCTYGVNLVVFVLSIDVFDICYDVCVECLWREKSKCLHLKGEEGNNTENNN